MNNNFHTTIITSFVIQFLFNIDKNVHGNPLNRIETQQLLSQIYNDESWNNNNNYVPEYQPKNNWMRELTDNDQETGKNDCKNSKLCASTIIDRPTKREMFVSRGWGAGGMPFNVLYMKNPKSNKSLRSSSAIVAEPLRFQSIPRMQQQFIPNDSFNLQKNSGGASTVEREQTSQGDWISSASNNGNGNSDNNNRPKIKGSNSVLVPSRRRFSIIPQLFVSYGWGPIGK